MRLKWFVSFGVLLIFLVGGLFFFKAKNIESMAHKVVSSGQLNSQLQTLVSDFSKQKPIQRLVAFYEQESKRIGQIDEYPELTQKRLEAVATTLNVDELNWLKKQTLDRALGGDARFFAVYMLALNATESSVDQLRDVALTGIPKQKNQGLNELETQIRAQAIEGIGRIRKNQRARDALLDIITKQNSVFLQDRAHRALYEWETGKSPESQDKEALGKVLYK